MKQAIFLGFAVSATLVLCSCKPQIPIEQPVAIQEPIAIREPVYVRGTVSVDNLQELQELQKKSSAETTQPEQNSVCSCTLQFDIEHCKDGDVIFYAAHPPSQDSVRKFVAAYCDLRFPIYTQAPTIESLRPFIQSSLTYPVCIFKRKTLPRLFFLGY